MKCESESLKATVKVQWYYVITLLKNVISNDFFKKPENGSFKTTEKQSEEVYIGSPNFLTAGYCLRSPESGQSGCNLAVKLTDIMICKGIRRRVSNLSYPFNQSVLQNKILESMMAQVICGETLSDSLRWISQGPCALVNDARSQREDDTLGKWKLFEEI